MTTESTPGTEPTSTATTTTATPSASSGVFEFSNDSELTGAFIRVGQAQATFERQQKALTRPDGLLRYSDAEHAERLVALRSDFDRVVGDVQQTADELITTHTRTLRSLTEGDPLDALSMEQLTKATQQAGYIREDAFSLPPTELVARCQEALRGGDVPTMYNLSRYVGSRLDASARAQAAGQEQAMAARASALMGGPVATTPTTSAASQDQAGDLTLAERQALSELVADLRTRVRGTRGEQTAEATRTKMQTALEVKAAARAAHDSVHDTKGRLEAHQRASGRYSI